MSTWILQTFFVLVPVSLFAKHLCNLVIFMQMLKSRLYRSSMDCVNKTTSFVWTVSKPSAAHCVLLLRLGLNRHREYYQKRKINKSTIERSKKVERGMEGIRENQGQKKVTGKGRNSIFEPVVTELICDITY